MVPADTNGHHPDPDRQWMLRALRGDIVSEGAYQIIRTTRYMWRNGKLANDQEAVAALNIGDNAHLDDAKRFEPLEPVWQPDTHSDPATDAAFADLASREDFAGRYQPEWDDPDDLTDPDLNEFLDTQDPDYDWLVEDLIERHDRIIVTGQEGQGKSTLLRQFGVQLASGIHPFNQTGIEPLQVLYVDCENSARQVRRKMRDLRTAADTCYQTGRLRLRVLGHALELANPAIEADLAARIHHQAVDVVIIGPLYKLISDDPNKELPAKAVADALDRLRLIRGSALIMEAHSPYAESNGKKRPIRPYGASLWSRWPEFGIHLGDDGTLTHWRGQRDERTWPLRLERTQPWPWAPGLAPTLDSSSDWNGPTECAAGIVALLAELNTELSTRKIGEELRARGHSYRDDTIRTAARLAHNDGRLAHRAGPRSSDLYQIQNENLQEALNDAF